MAFSQAGDRSGVRLATLVTLVTVAAVAARFGLDPQTPAFCYLAALGVPLAFIDAREHRLPDRLTAPAYAGTVALLAAAALVTHHPGQLGRAVLAGAGLAFLYLIMFLASPASIGVGDVKLAASVGTALGWLGWGTVVTGTVACFMIAGLFAAALLILRRAKRGDHMAFGPFILLGALAAIVI